MRRMLSVTSLTLAATLLAACGQRSPEATLTENWALVDRYCEECHNSAEFAGGLSLESMSPEQISEHPDVWENVVRKLRGNLMPPPGGPQPDPAQTAAFIAALETTLDGTTLAHGPRPGRVPVHRLNRAEYASEIRRILGLDINARAMLPGDISSDGFDNVAEVLRVSPTHIDQYIAAARDISIRAVGNPEPDPVRADYRPTLKDHSKHVHGLPLGTRGGMLVEHYFPADGEYEFNLNISPEPGTELRAYPQGWLEYRHKVIMTIDGVRVFEEELGGPDDLRAVDQRQIEAVTEIRNRFRDLRFDVRAGTREVGVTFVARTEAESDYLLESFIPGEGVPDLPRVLGVEVIGPYDPAGISGSTVSRDRIFICRPENEQQETPCAERILTNLARRAFRRPVTDEDLEPLLVFYRAGRAEGGFEMGIQRGLMAILASTKFLYRAEPAGPPADAAPGSAYPITDLELAWRLSFFLWNEGPDDELLELAEAGRLGEPDVLSAQVDRMLADPRAGSLVTNFGFQWLSVRNLDQIDPDVRLFPNFDEDLRNAFRREMELFLDSILLADRSVLDLLDARHTFVNERLARHYGIASVRGDHFRRVELDDPRRHGLFGKGSVLLVTSYPDRTSPVLRGAWIMEHVLGTPPSAPPPGVETNLTPVEGDVPRSVRERLELHRSEPSCNHCHGVIDPLGQALENFNAIGEWRTVERDSGVAVDPRGELAGGGRVAGPVDLREALLDRPGQFVQALTEKLMTYALGRGVEHHDMPTVRAIARRAADDDYRFRSIVEQIVLSEPFRMRAVPEVDREAVAAAGAAPGEPQGSNATVSGGN